VVVFGVADEEDGVGRFVEVEGAEVGAAAVELAVGVDVVEAAEVGEVVREAVVGDDFAEGVLAVGGEDGLGQAGGVEAREGFAGAGLEAAFVAAGVVGGDEAAADVVEGILRKVKAEPFVEMDDGEAKVGAVLLDGDRMQMGVGEKLVEDFDAEPGVVEEGAVLVPDDMPVAHGGRFNQASRDGAKKERWGPEAGREKPGCN